MSIRTDDEQQGSSPVIAFLAGVILTCGVGYGVLNDSPDLLCPTADAALCPTPPACPAQPACPAPTETPTTPTTTTPAPTSRFGLQGPAIVNVWLENCADCLPAFAAWRDTRAAGGLPTGATVYNVVYGGETATLSAFAERYGVTDNMIFDRGDRFVQPLGIGTFTTFVLDGRGEVISRMRPTDDAFASLLQAAWHTATPNE